MANYLLLSDVIFYDVVGGPFIFIEENKLHLKEVGLDLSKLISQLQRLIILYILEDSHVYPGRIFFCYFILVKGYLINSVVNFSPLDVVRSELNVIPWVLRGAFSALQGQKMDIVFVILEVVFGWGLLL